MRAAIVTGRTARRSHSRKKGRSFPSRFRTPKASGRTEWRRSSWLKKREARRGGSNWAICQP